MGCAEVAPNTYNVVHSDGFCEISCTQGAQRRYLRKGYDHGFSMALEQSQAVKGAEILPSSEGSSPALVGGLATALAIVSLSFLLFQQGSCPIVGCTERRSDLSMIVQLLKSIFF